jgi:DnaJ-class molecular chaperone
MAYETLSDSTLRARYDSGTKRPQAFASNPFSSSSGTKFYYSSPTKDDDHMEEDPFSFEFIFGRAFSAANFEE